MRKNKNSFKILHTPLIEVFKRIQLVYPIFFSCRNERLKVIFWKVFREKEQTDRQREGGRKKVLALTKSCPIFLMM